MFNECLRVVSYKSTTSETFSVTCLASRLYCSILIDELQLLVANHIFNLDLSPVFGVVDALRLLGRTR